MAGSGNEEHSRLKMKIIMIFIWIFQIFQNTSKNQNQAQHHVVHSTYIKDPQLFHAKTSKHARIEENKIQSSKLQLILSNSKQHQFARYKAQNDQQT